MVVSRVPMDEGEITLAHHPELPEATELEGGIGVFREGHDAARLPVQPMHHLRGVSGTEVEPDTPDKAGGCITFRRVADEASGLVDDEEVVVLVKDPDPAGLAGHLGSHFFQLAP